MGPGPSIQDDPPSEEIFSCLQLVNNVFNMGLVTAQVSFTLVRAFIGTCLDNNSFVQELWKVAVGIAE